MRERETVSFSPQTPQSPDQEIDYESLHGGVYDIFPTHKKELYEATVVLRGIASGVLEPDMIDELLEDEKLEQLFTSERVELGNRSALSYIRRTIERDSQLLPRK